MKKALSKKEIRKIQHRVYMRDWYFNAGIIGFLTVIFEDGELKNNEHLTIGDNYIEFDNDILKDFSEKYIKQLFLHLFQIKFFTNILEKAIGKNEESKKKITIKAIESSLQKLIYKDFFKIMGFSFKIKDVEKLISYIEKIKEKLQSFTSLKIYSILSREKSGIKYINNFLNFKMKGIISISDNITHKIKYYIDNILKTDTNKSLDRKNICIFCQSRKANLSFNNAISNIIGFNKDNTNWIWGYNANKLKICELCSLIYSCAIISFKNVTKKIGNDYINHFYLLNYNTSLNELYSEIKKFKSELLNRTDETKTLYSMIKKTVLLIKQKQTEKIRENINFIEIVENPMLAGQTTKGYNILNYNIDKDLANFLFLYLDKDAIPKGFYKNNQGYFNIDEELLKNTVLRRLSYQDVYRYFSFFISKSMDERDRKYNIYKVCKYIFDYFNYMKGGTSNMKEKNKIIGKAFMNGKELRQKLTSAKKENQINGIVYGMLNDLKISEREKFLDKYIRLMMSYGLGISFGKDEMLNIDDFLQFGYSFISGLLSEDKNENSKEDNL